MLSPNHATLWAAIAFVEKQVHENPLDNSGFYTILERESGFSLAYLREIFALNMGISLSRYILWRKICNAAFDLLHSEQSVLEIALSYGFTQHDTFTRAFKRVSGLTPSEFRRRRPPIGRIMLCTGVYGLGLLSQKEETGKMTDKRDQRSLGSVILYGVPKVGYGPLGITPYPMCVKSCANYLGQDVDHEFVMAASGAAFRLNWNVQNWDGGNVDVCFTFDDFERVYRLGVEALGRDCRLLKRTPESTKEEFIAFIKAEIDKGYPCLALGIIGPQEACIITGYKGDGQALLGWNFFQGFPEFAQSIEIDESGYFICDTWWENRETRMLIALGEQHKPLLSVKEILGNAVEVMTGRQWHEHAKGLTAYDAWKAALSNEVEFPANAILPLLAERLMCHGDAMDCLADGRACAAKYLRRAAEEIPGQKEALLQVAAEFAKVEKAVGEMSALLGGWKRGEQQMRLLADSEVRRKLCALIDVCKEADVQALHILKQVCETV